MSEAPLHRVLPFDEAVERSAGALRLVAAGAAGLGSIWLALLRPSPVGWVIAGLGALGSLAWIGMWARGRKKIARSNDSYLALEPDAMRIVDASGEVRVTWDTVADLEVDEDRLVVRVALASGREVLVEPTYGGLGVYDLELAVRAAWEAAA